MQVYKETIWHFTCQSCNGFWSIAASDKWVPTELFCTHCGSKRTHNPEKIEWVDDKDYLPVRNDSQHEDYLEFEKEFLKKDKNEGHIRFGTSSYARASEDTHTGFQKDICSCGHKVIDCDCKAGCECGCNKRFLGSY
jgi:hypothetical protein